MLSVKVPSGKERIWVRVGTPGAITAAVVDVVEVEVVVDVADVGVVAETEPASLSPAVVFATTLNEYATPAVRPTMEHVVSVVEHVAPPGDAVTVYPVVSAIPSSPGVHEISAEVADTTATTSTGALAGRN